MPLPTVTSEEMRRIDREAIETFKIPSLILMEHAGKALGAVCRNYLQRVRGKRVLVVAGKGNNAGDGFVAARWLAHYGYQVALLHLTNPLYYRGDTMTNWRICQKMKIREIRLLRVEPSVCRRWILKSSLVIDAIFGTGFKGPVDHSYKRVINDINQYSARIVSVDVPSGLARDGKQNWPCVDADVTVTMGLVKDILIREESRKYVGKLVVADIGIPDGAIKRILGTRAREHKVTSENTKSDVRGQKTEKTKKPHFIKSIRL